VADFSYTQTQLIAPVSPTSETPNSPLGGRGSLLLYCTFEVGLKCLLSHGTSASDFFFKHDRLGYGTRTCLSKLNVISKFFM